MEVQNTYIYYEIRGRKKCFPKIKLTFNELLVKEEYEGIYSVKKQRILFKKILVPLSSFVVKYAGNYVFVWEIVPELVISED